VGSTRWRLIRLKKAESFYTQYRQYPTCQLYSSSTYPRKFAKNTPISQIEDLVAENRTNEPSHSHHAQGAQSHEHEGVETTKLGGKRRVIAIVDHGGETKVGDAHSADSRADLADSPARAA
jgi:hypothetical protein